jgi:hypothetical protein
MAAIESGFLGLTGRAAFMLGRSGHHESAGCIVVPAQKSGLSGCGTAEFFPEYHWMFSAQTTSLHGARLGR